MNKGQAIAARHPIGPGVRALNPALFADQVAPAATKKRNDGAAKPRPAGTMNKTETAYSLILEAMKRRGDIVDWEREGITLRWPDGMTYTPDFTVTVKETPFTVTSFHKEDHRHVSDVRLLFVEVKGPRIESDALVKFRSARDKWGHRYRFELWQLRSSRAAWTKLL